MLAVVAVLAVFVGGVGLDNSSAVAKVKRDGDPPFEIQDFARSGFLLDSAMPAECEGQGWGAEGAFWASRYVGSAYACFGALWDPQSPGDLSLLLGSPGFSGKFWNIYSEGQYFVLMFDIDNDPNDNTDAVRHICISFSPNWQGWEDCVFVRYDGQKYNQQLRVHENRFSFAEAEFQAGGTVSNFSYLVLDDLADYVFGLAGRMPIVFDYYNGYRMTNDHSYSESENTGSTEVKRWCSNSTYTYRGGAYLAPFAYEMCLTPAVDTGYGTQGKSGMLKVGISPALKKILENNPSPIDHVITMKYAFIRRNGSLIPRSSIIRCGSIVPAGDGHVFECDTRTSIYADDSTLPKDEIIGIELWNFTTAPPQPPGVSVVALEVTQGLQDWGNNLTLVKNRRTVVRAFLETYPGSRREITAELHGVKIAGEPFEDPLSPVNPGETTIARANVTSRRGDINASLNFVLPDEWINLGAGEELMLELFPESGQTGCSVGTSTDLIENRCAEFVTFTEVTPLKIEVIPILIENTHVSYSQIDPHILHEQINRIRSVLPVLTNRFSILYGFNNNKPLKQGTSLDDINKKIYEGFAKNDRDTIYLGVLFGSPKDADGNNDNDVKTFGSARFGYNEDGLVGSWYTDDIDGQSSDPASHLGHNRNLGAHELGHILGLHHPGHIVDNKGEMKLYGMCSETANFDEDKQFEDPDNPKTLRLHEYIEKITFYNPNIPEGQNINRPALGPLGNDYTEVWGVDTRYVRSYRYLSDYYRSIYDELIVSDPNLVFSLMSYCSAVEESSSIGGKNQYVQCLDRDDKFEGDYVPECDFHRGGQGLWLDAPRHEYLVRCLSDETCLSSKPDVDVIKSGEGTSILGSDLLFGSIIFSSDGEATDVKFDTLFSRPRKVEVPVTGEYILELRDEGDNVLREIPFPLYRNARGIAVASEEVGFSVLLPISIDYSSFAVMKSGRELGVANRSASAPFVSITGIMDGQEFSVADLIDLSWTGTDADGDDLVYKLYYSTDSGENYRVLSGSTDRTSISYPVDLLEGSSEARIGISVSDGIRSSFAQTPVFSVALRVPEVQIVVPPSGAVLAEKQGFVLDAFSYDMEDGYLSSPAFNWTSSIDGHLGTGQFLVLSASDLTSGVHTISVAATDSDGLAAYDSVDITISNRNTLPIAIDDIVPVNAGGTVRIDVLANDIDIEGDIDLSTLSIGSQPHQGTVEISYAVPGRPAIEYSTVAGGPDIFTYFICDGLDRCDSAQVNVGFPECTITGTTGDDMILGTSGNDVICGLGGNDTIDARAGNDLIDSGPGDDTIYGRDGDDIIFGRTGNDFILAHRGDDIIYGGPGDDIIYGGGGNDTAKGEEGADELYGEADNDVLYGSYGADILHGGRGDDTIWGGDGSDTIRGNAGADAIYPGTGADTILGAVPEDTVIEP